MRVKDLLQWATNELQQCGIEEPLSDARLLLEDCLEKSRTEIILLSDSQVDSDQYKIYLQLIERRKRRQPVAYILGQCEFWSLPFYVTPDVLIPRPETEFLIDRVLALAKNSNITSGKILDLCCGSGVIAIVLARETGEKIVAIDISAGALRVAKLNGSCHDVISSVDFIQADLFSALLMKRKFSLVVANPPYVSSFEIDNNLQPEVAWFEPHLALDGGERGMEIINKIRRFLPFVLKRRGEVFMEIGAGQGEEVRQIFEEKYGDSPPFGLVEILVDYAGRDRVLHAELDS